MLPLLTVVVTTPPPPIWQVLLEAFSPLVAIGIAVFGVLRDNRLRRSAIAALERREASRALVRARRILVSGSTSSANSLPGHQMADTSKITITNTDDSPIYELSISGATRVGQPVGAEWRADDPLPSDLAFLDSRDIASFRGNWWRPGGNGQMEQGQLSSGSFTAIYPHMTWTDSGGMKFRMDGDGEVHIVI